MSNFVVQRSTIKFSLRNEISVRKMYWILQKACGKSMPQKNVCKWYIGVKKGRGRVNGLKCLDDYQRQLMARKSPIANKRLFIIWDSEEWSLLLWQNTQIYRKTASRMALIFPKFLETPLWLLFKKLNKLNARAMKAIPGDDLLARFEK